MSALAGQKALTTPSWQVTKSKLSFSHSVRVTNTDVVGDKVPFTSRRLNRVILVPLANESGTLGE